MSSRLSIWKHSLLQFLSSFLLQFFSIDRTLSKHFIAGYEKFVDYVLPRSALLIEEDSEFQLYRVVMFRKVVEDFKNVARERK
jgi:V-type H+-transporting ATPase subunit C